MNITRVKHQFKDWLGKIKSNTFPKYFFQKGGFYSQYQQDQFVANYFQNKRGGFFVDVGAYDGVQGSNTLYLEKELAWKGLAVEANPIVFKKLKKNRACKCLQLAISDQEKEAQLRLFSGWCEQLSSLHGKTEPSHESRIQKELVRTGSQQAVISVRTKRLKTVLEVNRVFEVDYLSIDIEGGEAAVIRSLLADKRFQVQLISVESNNPEKAFSLPGYRPVVRLGVDLVFEKKSIQGKLTQRWAAPTKK